MQLSGSYHFDAPQEVVWEMLQDPDVLARVMPGCEELEQIGENKYKGKLKIKIGPVNGRFNGQIELADINAPNSYTMKVNGQGPQGIINGEGKVRLEEEGGGTEMYYDGDATVSGRIASVGQRLMESSAKAITKQVLQGVEDQIEARQAADAAAANAEEVGEPQAVDAAQAKPGSPPPTPSEIDDLSKHDEQDIQEHAAPVNAQPTRKQMASSGASGRASVDSSNWSAARSAPPPPSQMEFAMGVAQEMVNDFLDEDQQRYAAIAAVIAFVWLLNRIITGRITQQTADQVIQRLRDENVI